MNNYALQSYFKKVSEALKETCNQIIRLENERTKLSENDSNEEKIKKLVDEAVFWAERFQVQLSEIDCIVKEAAFNHYKFIVTTEEEVYALLSYFAQNKVFDIVNVDDNVRDSFPQSEMSKEFFKAYVLADEDGLKKVIEKYF